MALDDEGLQRVKELGKPKFVAATLTLLALGAVLPPVAVAGAYPGTGAPISALNKLTPEGDTANPFAYPFLIDIAKSLAKAGLPPGFFLQGDAKSGAAIDLRAILLFEAGILKAPVKMMVPSKKRDEKVPSLSLPAIPDSGKQFPGDEQPAVSTTAPGPGSDSTVSKPDAGGPKLSLDFDRFQLELIKPQNKNELVASPGMTFAARTPPSAGADVNSFRFWTLRTEGPPLAPFNPRSAMLKSDYQGSFVVAMPGAVKSIDGRVFGLKQGGLLAYSQGKPLVLDASKSQVVLSPGSAVAVDNKGKGVIEMHVLETGSDSVSVKFKNKGGLEELRLRAGEQLVWSEAPLSPGEKSLISNPLPGPGNHAETWAKGKFSPAAYAEKSQLFKGDLLIPSSEFTSAVKLLRGRLK